jgi:hypothetical protein
MHRVGGDVLRESTWYSQRKNVRGQLRRVLSLYGRRDLYRGCRLLVRKAELVDHDCRNIAVTLRIREKAKQKRSGENACLRHLARKAILFAP